MSPETERLVRESWDKLRPKSDEVVAAFYTRLFDANPSLAGLFQATNMAEQRRKFADELRARAEQRGHANLVVVHGDARVLAPRLFAAGSLDAIHVHFPDPWWKRRHHRRRLVDEGMSTLLLRLLRPGGLLDFRTDVERYALEAVERLEGEGFQNEAGRGAFSVAPPDEIPSTREKRYLATGQQVWRLRLRRPA